MTAAVIVGEKLTTMTATSAAIARRGRPPISGAMGSQGHATQPTAMSPAIGTASVQAVVRAIGPSRSPRRSMFRVSPAMRAMRVVAMPLTTAS